MSKYTLEFVDSPLSKDMEKTETNSGDGETYHQLQMETKLNYIQKTRKYKNMDTYEVRNSIKNVQYHQSNISKTTYHTEEYNKKDIIIFSYNQQFQSFRYGFKMNVIYFK